MTYFLRMRAALLAFFAAAAQPASMLIVIFSMAGVITAAVAAQPGAQPAGMSDSAFAKLKAAIRLHTKGKVILDAAYPSPVPGIYEAVSSDDVFYVDATGRYGFVDGRLVDLVASQDLTALRIDRISQIDFTTLPLDLAIKEVRGNGRRKVAVFEDPMCPICRSHTKFLAQLPDTTVYRFMFPVVDPKASVEAARGAWCAADRRAAWETVMRGGSVPAAPVDCDITGLGRIIQLAQVLRIHETPTVFLGDGKRLKGATPPEDFLKALDASTR